MTSVCTILCATIDYGKVLDAIESLTEGELSLEGTRDKWTRISVAHSGKQITFSSLVRLRPQDKFSKLVLSTYSFFRLVETDMVSNKDYVLSRIADAEMMVGVVADPEFATGDSRLDILWKIAECMDAVIFNGDAILDLQGQRILDHNGDFDVIVE